MPPRIGFITELKNVPDGWIIQTIYAPKTYAYVRRPSDSAEVELVSMFNKVIRADPTYDVRVIASNEEALKAIVYELTMRGQHGGYHGHQRTSQTSP